jgi:hypothetical protein
VVVVAATVVVVVAGAVVVEDVVTAVVGDLSSCGSSPDEHAAANSASTVNSKALPVTTRPLLGRPVLRRLNAAWVNKVPKTRAGRRIVRLGCVL